MLKKKDLGKEVGITGMLEVTVMGGCLIKTYAPRKPFGFEMYVLLVSTIGPTTVKSFP